MSKKVDYLNLRVIIEQKIKENGGWVNCHGHFDRAFTITPEKYKLANAYRHEKWKLNADIRKTSTVDQIYDRMAAAIELLISQGVSATCTFIDVDYDVKDKAIKAAQKLRENYSSQIIIKFINQSSYGILTKETREWFEIGADFVDIIGGLLKADEGHEEEHLDILLSAAKKRKKMLHVHIDELNIPEEKETEMLAKKTIMHGMEGKVVGIHGISINAHPKAYREQIYRLIKKAALIFVSCPMSWLNARRSETLAPIHNPIIPLDEMYPLDIPIAIGIDNLADIFMPYNDGNMWNDLRVLMETNRFYDIDGLVKIATTNGRKALGIEDVSLSEDRPFYDPLLSYEENCEKGPFSVFANSETTIDKAAQTYDFLGEKVTLPFGIPAGPLVNGKFVKAALDKGFDLVTYKTVRTRQYPCHPWPNVVGVQLEGDLTIEKSKEPLVATVKYSQPLSITNSFGVPSFKPDFWQSDLADAVTYAKKGQIVIGSFQGTTKGDGNVKAYIRDFVKAAQLVKETGVKILEANLSCPNEGTAHLLCFDIERTRLITEAVKNKIGTTPLLLKLAYFQDDEQLKKLVKLVGPFVQGLSVINTMQAAIVDEKGEQALPGKGRLYSGVCGHAIKWAGIDMVKRLHRLREELQMDFSIIGVGGVITPDDYAEYITAGADAVMSATGAMWNPYLAVEIKERLGIEFTMQQSVKKTNGKYNRYTYEAQTYPKV